jgi:hypothetical protein
VKEFVVYTVMRLLLFIGSFGVVLGIWIKLLGHEASLLWPLVVAFLLSGVLSMFLLNRPREAFARKVEQRAQRAAAKASERLDEMRARED